MTQLPSTMSEGTASRRTYAAEFAVFAASTAAFQASRLGTGLVAAKTLSPSDYGLWGLFIAVLSYSNFANLGILSGANRDLPIAVGAGDRGLSVRIERAAFGASIVTCCFVATASLLVLLPTWGILGLLIAAALGLQQLYLFYQVSLRARLNFNEASIQQFVLAVVFAATGLLLIRSLGVSGLMSAQLAAFSLACLLGALVWRRTLRPSFSPQEARSLLKTGFPIMAAGLLFAVFTTVDRWLVAVTLGAAALGQYTLAALLSSGALLAATVVAQQFYPRMAMLLGATGGSAGLYVLAVRQSTLIIAIVLPIGVAVAVVAPLIIPALLPSYAPSIGAIQVLAIAIVPLVAASGFTNMLVAIGRARAYLMLLLLGMCVEFAAATVSLAVGAGLVGIAGSALVGYSCFLAATAIVARRSSTA